MKKNIILVLMSMLLALPSCDYLDIVPDNVATMDMIFQTRNSAEKMLYTCYNYIPSQASPWSNPGIGSSDEVWNISGFWFYDNKTSFNIAKGLQNTSDPYLNYWSGGQHGSNLFIGIRDCNIFLENIDKVLDMDQQEINRWKAEVTFIKAYLHIYLLQLYGPIPFIDKNIDVSASPEEVMVVREPVDDVVAKICKLLDEAASYKELPDHIRARATELGRITRPIVLATKAKLLTYAASPLFNGNDDFANYKDAEGRNLINPKYDPKKWEVARDACKKAIECAEKAGHKLHEFDGSVSDLSDTTKLELTLRQTITQRFNDEIIWGWNPGVVFLAQLANANLTDFHYSRFDWHVSMHNPTLDVVEQFYTQNGVPIDEDKSYPYKERYNLVDVPRDHAFYIDTTAEYTSRLLTFREPRFYSWIGFDRGKWYNLEAEEDEYAQVLHCQKGEIGGKSREMYSCTGFFAKKLVPYDIIFTQASNNAGDVCNYSFPIMRLSDLYLLYAECLNECKAAPDEEVYEYIQRVRTKAGLDKETGSFIGTWQEYSSNPNKPKTKEGMREIIRRERLIELAFEGQRFHDLRRWKLSMDYVSRPVRGFTVSEKGKDFYTPTYLYKRDYTLKDYFWPIKLDDLYRNKKLQQSPYWD